MSLHDRHGNALSTHSAEAVLAYDRALAELNHYCGDPIATIDAGLAADPRFVMGHCLKAGLFLSSSEGAAEPLLRECVEAAEKGLEHALPRERAHVRAARAWLDRDFARSIALYGLVAAEFPRDLLALQIAHLGDFLLGQAPMLRDRPQGVLPAWEPGEAGYSTILGMQAFGLEECGDYVAAEAVGRRAIDLEPRDAWAVHAVAHVMEMQGRALDGIDWLRRSIPPSAEGSFFAYHNWWHLALFHLDLEETDRALELYDTRIRVKPSAVAMELIDATAMLWRLRLRGVDVGARWEEVADHWQASADDGYYPFNSVHGLLAFIATGRQDLQQRALRALSSVAEGSTTNGMMSRDVGLPLAVGLMACERRDFDLAIEKLHQVRAYAHRFGGSHAQRDLIQLTLMECALRSGKSGLAKTLARERLAMKPASPFNRALARRAARMTLDVSARRAA